MSQSEVTKRVPKVHREKNDRQALSKWNKGKEKAEEAIKASVDAYVEKRREESLKHAFLKMDTER